MDDNLTPADASDLAQSISFALRFDDDEFMANLTADRIVRHLEKVG